MAVFKYNQNKPKYWEMYNNYGDDFDDQQKGSKLTVDIDDLENMVGQLEDDGEIIEEYDPSKDEEFKDDEYEVNNLINKHQQQAAPNKGKNSKKTKEDDELDQFMKNQDFNFGDIENDLNEFDPSFQKKKQQQTTQPQRQQQQQQQQQQKQVPQQQKQVVSSQPKQSSGPSSQVLKMIQEEKYYHDTALFASYKLIVSEEEFLVKAISNPKLDQYYLEHCKDRLKTLQNLKKKTVSNIQGGTLNAQTYIAVLEQVKKKHFLLIKEANEKGLKLHISKIDLLNQEIKQIQANPKLIQQYKDGQTSSSSSGGSVMGSNHSTQSNPESKSSNKGSQYILQDYNRLSPEQQIEILDKRRIEYKALAKYLFQFQREQKNTEINNKWVPLIQKCKEFITQISEGNEIDINDFLHNDMPPLKPEFLHGKTIQEKNKEINLVLGKIEENIAFEDKTLENLQTQGKGGFKLKDSKQKIDEYNSMIDKFVKAQNDEWIPIPSYSFVQEFRESKAGNPEIPENIMKISFRRLLNAPSQKFYITYSIDCSHRTYTDTTQYVDQANALNYSAQIQTTPDPKQIYKELCQKSINIILYKKGLFSSDRCAQAQISLAQLEKFATIQGKVDLPYKVSTLTLEYVIQIREPLSRTTRIKIETVKIIQEYPQFNLSYADEPAQQKPVSIAPKTQTQTQQQQPQQNAQKPQSGKAQTQMETEEPVIPTNKEINWAIGVTQEELVNFDDDQFLAGLSFCEPFTGQLEKIKTILISEGLMKESKRATQLFERVLKYFMGTGNKINNGDISIQDYRDKLQFAKDKTQIMLNFFKANKFTGRVIHCEERLAYLTNELKEIEEAMAENG